MIAAIIARRWAMPLDRAVSRALTCYPGERRTAIRQLMRSLDVAPEGPTRRVLRHIGWRALYASPREYEELMLDARMALDREGYHA